jgi:hypothetical protein
MISPRTGAPHFIVLDVIPSALDSIGFPQVRLIGEYRKRGVDTRRSDFVLRILSLKARREASAGRPESLVIVCALQMEPPSDRLQQRQDIHSTMSTYCVDRRAILPHYTRHALRSSLRGLTVFRSSLY